ncbi:MAG: hypothetical protein ACI8Y7_000950 [Candidatus Woesearchaeota archaeon]|jgi:uncharacterized protein YuzE
MFSKCNHYQVTFNCLFLYSFKSKVLILKNMKTYNFDYDKQHDTLFLYSCKSVKSVSYGSIILDYDSYNNIVGLELLHASTILKNQQGEPISKTFMTSLTSCHIAVDDQQKELILTFKLTGKYELTSTLLIPRLVR